MPQKTQSSTDTQGKRTVLIVDDHPIVRQGLAQLINQENDLLVCGQAEDAHEAIQAIRELDPDMVIVDISLQGHQRRGADQGPQGPVSRICRC